jgi:hypothetical protein
VAGASLERLSMAKRQAADERAKALAPIVRELRETGFDTLRAMADELNKRNITTAYGRRWYASSVLNLLARLRQTQEP